MSSTHIHTKDVARAKLSGTQGEVAEIVNQTLCDAKNVTAMLRWLSEGDCYSAEPLRDTHQLIYLIDGNGIIRLEDEDYVVRKGAGVYLGPSESVSVSQAGDVPTKLLHLVVPRVDD